MIAHIQHFNYCLNQASGTVFRRAGTYNFLKRSAKMRKVFKSGIVANLGEAHFSINNEMSGVLNSSFK